MTDNELIEAVAKEIMQWHLDKQKAYLPGVWRDKNGMWQGRESGEDMFNPLTDMNHMMMVVERMRINYLMAIKIWSYAVGDYIVTFCCDAETSPKPYSAQHKSLGHAVCLAALEAVRQGKDD